MVLEIALAGGLVAAFAAAVVFARRARAAERRAADLTAGVESTGELAASLDPDEVTRRTLDAAAALPGVDAVLLEAPGPDGTRSRAARGLTDEEVERVPVQGQSHTNLRAIDVLFRYRIDDADKAASFLRAGLVLPLVASGSQIGSVTAFTRTHAAEFPGETVTALERLAVRAGAALDNAQRFAEARLLADIDSLTGLENRRRFHELLAAELARARRYERKLALVVFDLDDFKAINDRVGHLAGDLALAEVAKRVQAVVRTADIACRVGGDEFAVIMPESSLAEAELIAERITRTVSERPLGEGHSLQVSAGIAEWKEDDDSNEFFGRADDALYRAKNAGKGHTVAAS